MGDAVGGHFFDADQFDMDPWAKTVNNVDDTGSARASRKVHVGKSLKETVGRTLVVHDATGARIACGVLTVAKEEISLEVEQNTCSAHIGHCGTAYQTCCVTYGAQGYPCGCSLTDGSGASKGDCGTCGAGYQVCCDGYKSQGDACQCDVIGPAAGIFA